MVAGMALWVLCRTSITVLVINVLWKALNFPVDGRVSLHTSCLDNDSWLCDLLCAEKKCILLLMVSRFANTVIVHKYSISQHKNNYCAFVFPIQLLRRGTKGSHEYVCLLTSWLDWIGSLPSHFAPVISNNLLHCYNTYCDTLNVDTTEKP